jgi:hypothetical protein
MDTPRRANPWFAHDSHLFTPCLGHALLGSTSRAPLCFNHGCSHLAIFHNSFSFFDKPAVSIERYQTENAELLLEHSRERHGLDVETFPDYWSSESQRKTKWRCGVCQGVLKSWKERAHPTSLHFTREGAKMKAWRDLSHVSFPLYRSIYRSI